MIRHGSGERSNLTPHSIQDLSRQSSQLAAVRASSHGSLADFAQGHSLQPQLYTIMNTNSSNNINNNINSTPHSSTSSFRQRQGNALAGVISTNNSLADVVTRANQTDAYMCNMSNNINKSMNETAMYHEGYTQHGSNMLSSDELLHHRLAAQQAMRNNGAS